MEKTGFTEIGRFSASSAARDTHRGLVNMRIQNDTDYAMRVVILVHRNHDLDEHRVLVNAHQAVTTHCSTGEVVVVVFNVDSNSVYGGYVLNVAGDFSFPIT
jgi:hypothetical protein